MIKKFIKFLFNRPSHHEAGHPPKPRTLLAKEHQIHMKDVSSAALKVVQALQEKGFRAYVVGGAVRDLLLKINPKDFDVATNARPEEVQRIFRRARIIGKRFRIVHVQFGHEIIEVSTFRAQAQNDIPTDEHGRVLRDNTYGEQHEDAARRDFTINALYYDPIANIVIDYHQGCTDLKNKVLRMIGDPAVRYREDPVRMLRVVRFAAKLQFSIETQTHTAIASQRELLRNIPSARLFDEILKLLTSGHAQACLEKLRQENLHQGVLPLLDTMLDQPQGQSFIRLALSRTDERVQQGKSVSPSFLLATLLWHLVLQGWQKYQKNGEYPTPALFAAIDDILEKQAEQLAIPRRLTADMREIWSMQLRFDKRVGGAPYRMIEQARFRAAYDFLLLRCDSKEIEPELGEWWTKFIEATHIERENLIRSLKTNGSGGAPKKRRRKRKPKPHAPDIDKS